VALSEKRKPWSAQRPNSDNEIAKSVLRGSLEKHRKEEERERETEKDGSFKGWSVAVWTPKELGGVEGAQALLKIQSDVGSLVTSADHPSGQESRFAPTGCVGGVG